MSLSDADEILPLIDRNSGDQQNSSVQYQSLNERKNCVLKGKSLLQNVVKHNNALGGCNCTNQSYSNPTLSRGLPEQKITYVWNNLSVYRVSRNRKFSFYGKIRTGNPLLEQSKRILKSVHGVANPRELLAIMGASGAGKTTLLNALTFRSGNNTVVEGVRYLNGAPIADRISIAGVSAYVEQENLFIGTLTVKEHLIFQSLVRIGSNLSYRHKLKRVEDVITELDLEKCQNTVIGFEGRTKGISGGERKRLSFASEILTNPPMMFCDEPTSGLDSFMALNVINVLKSMAIRGKTVICTIHQPSSEIFSLFDKILLVAEGRTAFLGTPAEAVTFFEGLGAPLPTNYNPADFFIQLLAIAPNQEEICKKNVNLICDHFEESRQGLEIANKINCESQESYSCRRCGSSLNRSPKPFTYAATWSCQFRALFWRCWINILKEPILVKVRLFQTVILSLVVGLIYHGQKLNEDGVMNINGVLFTFLTNMTFQNLFAVISVFCSELPVFMKEQSMKLYRVDAYFMAKTLAEAPIFLAVPIIFTSITYYWINLNAELYHFGLTILILILVTNVATSFGYFISCVSTNIVMALSIGPPITIPFLLFGGFLLNTGAVPVYFKWLSYFSWFRYGNEALLINQWADNKNIECNTTSATCPRTGEIVLEIYHFDKLNFWWDISSLLVLIIIFRLLGFLALLWKANRHDRC